MADSRVTSRALSPVLLLPLLVCAYPIVRALLARSEVPLVLGRYSTLYFVLNLLNLGVIGLVLFAWRRRSHLQLQIGYVALIAITVLIPMNNQLRYACCVVFLMPAVRLLAGLGCVFVEFDRCRTGAVAPRPIWLVLGFVVLTVSLLDYSLFAVLALGDRSPEGGLRVEYDYDEISIRDVVLVGDSFVWGEGVELQERFGDRLESLYSERGDSTRVFSLGETGIGLAQYENILSDLKPRLARRVVVFFYMNDMLPHETLLPRIQDLSKAIGRGFPTARLVGDKFARLLSQDVEAYHRFVIESYREDHDSYSTRWDMTQEHIRDLARLASDRSVQTPLMVIIPIIVDFRNYPLERAHDRLSAAAMEAGFEVVDLLPVFREKLVDGNLYRAGPDDNHFDAETHDLVARLLFRKISGSDGSVTP